jgi:hypothetical protein
VSEWTEAALDFDVLDAVRYDRTVQILEQEVHLELIPPDIAAGGHLPRRPAG